MTAAPRTASRWVMRLDASKTWGNLCYSLDSVEPAASSYMSLVSRYISLVMFAAPKEPGAYTQTITFNDGANKSQERIDALPAYDTAGIKSHTDSRDGAKTTASLSLGVAVVSLVYGYFAGVFTDN